MTIDWAATGNWMQAWAGFAQAGVILFAAYKGADVFQAWRRQKIAERRLETAERILTVAYRIRRAFASIRSPFMSAGELEAAETKLKANGDWLERLPEQTKRTTVHAQAVYDRINHFSADWDELLGAMPVARAFFGEELENALQLFWRQRGTVSAAAHSYADDRGNDENFSQQIRRNLWEGYGSHDGGVNEIDDAVADAFTRTEAILQPVLSDSVD